MKAYLDIVEKVLNKGEFKKNLRTGEDTLAIAGEKFEHEMSEGFPLLTTKNVPLRLVSSELEFLIKGITDKKWLQNENNHIWDEWCNPEKVPYSHDEKTKKKMIKERDLGPIYGFQWRHFGAEYKDYKTNYENEGVDQLENLITKLKTDPTDRRMIVSAWNPKDLKKMALPPCHYCFQTTVINGKLNLLWNQRSVDIALGLPFNIASYATLLHLIAKETGFKEGKLVGFLSDVHIYANHIEGLKEQLKREPYPLSRIETKDFKSIFNWTYKDSEIWNYRRHPKITFEVAV